jgi:hypothetical protein
MVGRELEEDPSSLILWLKMVEDGIQSTSL